MYSSINFGQWLQPYYPHPYQDLNHFIHPRKFSCVPSKSMPLFFVGVLSVLSFLPEIIFVNSRTFYKWKHTLGSVLYLRNLSMLLSVSAVHSPLLLSIHSPVDGYSCCFCFWEITNKAVNILVQIFLWAYIFILLW